LNPREASAILQVFQPAMIHLTVRSRRRKGTSPVLTISMMSLRQIVRA
jgi:hypothetical protein